VKLNGSEDEVNLGTSRNERRFFFVNALHLPVEEI
jgi:hypothetical protein